MLNGINQTNGFQNRFEFQGKEKESNFSLNRINLGARSLNPTIGRFDRVDPLAEIFPTITSYHYAINSPILFTDRYGLYPEPSQNIAICPTCPSGQEYDKYRESKDLFTYDKQTGIVVNGDGIGATVTARREAFAFDIPWQLGFTIGAAEWNLGNKIEKIAKWDGTSRYPNSILSQEEINARAIYRQPLIKKRPINILGKIALPRGLALKAAQGLKWAGVGTTFLGVVDVLSKAHLGNITIEHGLVTLAVTGVSLATGGLGGIAIGVVYAIYENDLWHDYDKANATNFIEKKE